MKRIAILSTVTLVALALLVTAGALAAGCGEEQKQAKADLNVALTEFEAAVAELEKLTATSTVADLKKANDGLAVPYGKVVEAADKVSGADVTAFETAWKELQNAVAAVPDDASIVTAYLLAGSKIQPVVDAEKALKELVAP